MKENVDGHCKTVAVVYSVMNCHCEAYSKTYFPGRKNKLASDKLKMWFIIVNGSYGHYVVGSFYYPPNISDDTSLLLVYCK